jgi:hypothetical protein
MTDEAGPFAEVAKATGEIVRTARKAGGYLAAVFGSVPHDLVGILGATGCMKRGAGISRSCRPAPTSCWTGLPANVDRRSAVRRFSH